MSISLKHPLSLIASSNPQKHRFQLVAFSLFTILVSILGIGIILIVLEFDATHFKQYAPERSVRQMVAGEPELSDSLYFRHQLDLAAVAQDEKKEFREFFLKICQTVLLNLLLPTLTATLGYKLGTSKED